MREFLLLLTFGVLVGCAEPAATPEAPPTVDSTTTLLSVDLTAQDIPLFVEMGDAATLGVDAPQVEWNEEMGRVEVRAGDHFGITIREVVADLARLRADLDRDMLQKHTVIEEAPDRIIYRSQFPDEALVFVHFLQVVTAQDRSFIIQDDPNGRFNEADVARMAKAVRTQRAV